MKNIQIASEYEFVASLTESEYTKLTKTLFQNVVSKILTNTYYKDLKDIFLNNGITFRVRKNSNRQQFFLEVKIPILNEHGVRIGGSYEFTQGITSAIQNALTRGEIASDKIREALQPFKVSEVSFLGILKTKRHSLNVPEIMGQWALDKVKLPDGTHFYRLELEYDKKYQTEARELFNQVLKKYKIQEITPPSKFQTLWNWFQENNHTN